MLWPMTEVSAQSDGVTINRPVTAARVTSKPQAKPARVKGEISAEELNRRFNAQLQIDRAQQAAPVTPASVEPQAAPATPASVEPQVATPVAVPPSPSPAPTVPPPSRDEAKPGFFDRMFGTSRTEPPPADGLAPRPDPAPVPTQAQVAPPPSAPSGGQTPPPPSAPSGGQLAQAPSLPPPQPVPLPGQPPTTPVQPAPPPAPVPPPPGMTTIPVQPQVAPPPPDRAQRDFGRAAVVPTEAPTMQIEVSKGTMVRLKGPATTVFVANPDIADVQVKSPTQIYVFGKKPGETSLYATDGADNVLINTIVRVTHEHSRLHEALRRIAPGTQLQFQTVGDMIFINGTARNAGEIQEARRIAGAQLGNPDRVVVQASVDAPSQVLLRVRVIEAQRQALKRVGINWEAAGRIGSFALGLATPTDIAFGAAGELLRQGAPSGGLLNIRNQGTNRDINGVVDLLATENFIAILAEPNLVALSGETASFLAGGEFPVVTTSGVNQVSVSYKQFGVSLAFTPTIYGDSRINLKVRPEVSQLSTQGQVVLNGFTIPALTTRRAETTVELGSGQSFMIGGLINNTSTQDISKLPGLGDLPILGALFRSDAFQRNETELVILVTPYLVRPSSGRMMSPTDGLVPPNDGDRYLYGRTYRQQPAGQGGPVRRVVAGGGFMID
ncbi:MAG: pilus assembly protein N-terminal domain-containing protein [Alphaproteobacteria bacterium]|nr:pilus assembly protein N-terminal domain-containing protein [Alphaproteobacteria bacterium]